MTTGSVPVERRPRTSPRAGRRSSWSPSYIGVLRRVDVVVVVTAVLIAYAGRFGSRAPLVSGVPYMAVAAMLALAWLGSLRLMRGYDIKIIGHGAEEYRRVLGSGLRLAGLVAIVCYLADAPVARGFVALAFPLGTFGLLTGRYTARKWLHHRRRAGDGWSHRVLVVGDGPQVEDLVRQLRREPYAGYQVVGVCTPDGGGVAGAPGVGTLDELGEALTRVAADTVAVTASAGITATTLRRLGWELHGTGVGLVVAPALVDIAGPRIHTSPVAGLPLIHVEEPELAGRRRAMKHVVDRLVALVALVALLPVLAVVALAVRLDTPGPALFRQVRVGRDGRPFTMYKFRSMTVDAEARRAALAEWDDHDGGVLFKIRRDPRVTPVGRVIRKWSLDELPQLVNVARGEMSLVGPRPPLPEEVARYGADVARRLLVQPGITGLWQVSGRSDLSWEDSVRLDLYYVENWSLTTDAIILWKTVGAVFRRTGAY
ncbi:sugar transferase [Actinomadura craniellae]|uniref:sugar transferase n=1 Tax=Actinomadura craniellae TaxID=2231787 RepID=UPI0018F18541|nr:sugar transferase [Actinomadura craniellae]